MLAWIASLAIAGCRSPETATVEPLRIAAASDLQRVLPRLVTPFQANSTTGVPLFFDAFCTRSAPLDNNARMR